MGSTGTTYIFATFLLYAPPIRSLLPPSPLPKDDVPLFLGQLISPRLQQVYEDVHIDSMPTPARSGAPPFTSTSDLPCAFPDGVQLGSKGGRHSLHVDGAEPRVFTFPVTVPVTVPRAVPHLVRPGVGTSSAPCLDDPVPRLMDGAIPLVGGTADFMFAPAHRHRRR